MREYDNALGAVWNAQNPSQLPAGGENLNRLTIVAQESAHC
jgi:hypothetical protein